MHPKFDPTGVRTHDLQIMTTFHVTEMPTPTTWQSVTSKRNVLSHYLRGLRCFQMHGLSDRLTYWPLLKTLNFLCCSIKTLSHYGLSVSCMAMLFSMFVIQ